MWGPGIFFLTLPEQVQTGVACLRELRYKLYSREFGAKAAEVDGVLLSREEQCADKDGATAKRHKGGRHHVIQSSNYWKVCGPKD